MFGHAYFGISFFGPAYWGPQDAITPPVIPPNLLALLGVGD